MSGVAIWGLVNGLGNAAVDLSEDELKVQAQVSRQILPSNQMANMYSIQDTRSRKCDLDSGHCRGQDRRALALHANLQHGRVSSRFPSPDGVLRMLWY